MILFLLFSPTLWDVFLVDFLIEYTDLLKKKKIQAPLFPLAVSLYKRAT